MQRRTSHNCPPVHIASNHRLHGTRDLQIARYWLDSAGRIRSNGLRTNDLSITPQSRVHGIQFYASRAEETLKLPIFCRIIRIFLHTSWGGFLKTRLRTSAPRSTLVRFRYRILFVTLIAWFEWDLLTMEAHE